MKIYIGANALIFPPPQSTEGKSPSPPCRNLKIFTGVLLLNEQLQLQFQFFTCDTTMSPCECAFTAPAYTDFYPSHPNTEPGAVKVEYQSFSFTI